MGIVIIHISYGTSSLTACKTHDNDETTRLKVVMIK